MTAAIMQPYLFPYIGYWQLINAADTFVLLDDVNYIRRGWMARNRFLCDGSVRWFHVPISKPSQNRRICDTQLHPDPVPRENIVKTLRYAYRDEPRTKNVMPMIE
ncbi:MAG: WbqC family protein, partial [Clostridiales bacterium]|nr:WbqC family protein [Clostridiales bacterium]